MTVLLGRDPDARETGELRPSRSGFRTDESWEARRRRCRQARWQAHPTWQPAPNGARHSATLVFEPVQESPSSGMLDLYAGRVSRQPQCASAPRRAAPHERALVCGGDDAGVQRRGYALIPSPRELGRGSSDHYLAMHPRTRRAYSRLRSGGAIARPRTIVLKRRVDGRRHPVQVWRGVLAGFSSLIAGATGSSIQDPRRILIAAIAALIVVASAATSGFAGQQRYEVRDGDTVESVAATFGVDPAAIRTSSYLPTGDDLQAGQVIIIPEPGQSPSDAAQMAAANEGTSPWVATAHWIEPGETVASIAAAYGVSPEAIIEFNAITDPGNLAVGSRVLIPDGGDAIDSSPGNGAGSAAGPAVAVPGITGYAQQRNLSCEYAAVHIATGAFGNAIPEDAFTSSIPQASNPHHGYRGNIDGPWGNTDDYGIYPEPLLPVLDAWGFSSEVMYTGGDPAPLIAHLDAGHPVVVWLGFWGDTRETLTDDGTYSVFAGMHVVTVYGYDEGGIYVADPATGGMDFYSWDEFVSMWSVVDGMSLAIAPR